MRAPDDARVEADGVKLVLRRYPWVVRAIGAVALSIVLTPVPVMAWVALNGTVYVIEDAMRDSVPSTFHVAVPEPVARCRAAVNLAPSSIRYNMPSDLDGACEDAGLELPEGVGPFGIDNYEAYREAYERAYGHRGRPYASEKAFREYYNLPSQGDFLLVRTYFLIIAVGTGLLAAGAGSVYLMRRTRDRRVELTHTHVYVDDIVVPLALVTGAHATLDCRLAILTNAGKLLSDPFDDDWETLNWLVEQIQDVASTPEEASESMAAEPGLREAAQALTSTAATR